LVAVAANERGFGRQRWRVRPSGHQASPGVALELGAVQRLYLRGSSGLAAARAVVATMQASAERLSAVGRAAR
jgi:hypothetical protein